MDYKKFIHTFISLGSFYYLLISVAILLFSQIVPGDSSNHIIIPSQFLKILILAFMMSLGSALKKLEKLSLPVRCTLHAFCYIGGCLLFLVICGLKFTPAIVVTALFAILYAIEALIAKAIRKAKEKSNSSSVKAKNQAPKKQKNAEYTSMFSGK